MSFQPRTEHGFVLITSLIFLVVITLLAVSAINSSTLQEHMASNLRDRSRALQAADTTLRYAETLLDQSVFDTYQPAGTTYGSANTSKPASTGVLRIWKQNSMFSGNVTDTSLAFLDTAIWSVGNVQRYTPDTSMPAVTYFVEEFDSQFQPRDLNPDTRASGDGGVIYRITARAQGQNPAAIAVTQSLYEKRY